MSFQENVKNGFLILKKKPVKCVFSNTGYALFDRNSDMTQRSPSRNTVLPGIYDVELQR